MNFLKQVLSTATETQLTNVREKIPRLVTQVNRLKCEVKKYMINSHVDLKAMNGKSNRLLEDTNLLNEEMEEVVKHIECLIKKELESSKSELVNLEYDLKETKYALSLVTQLLEMDDHLKAAKNCLSNKSYLEAIKSVNLIKKILKEIPEDEELDIIQGISVDTTIEHESILSEAGKVWSESVQLHKKVNEEDLVLSIKINNSRSEELKQSIQALCYENSFVFELQCLSNFLMNEVFTSIINNYCSVKIDEKDGFSTVIIKVCKSRGKQPYKIVFDNLCNVFEFISATINFGIRNQLMLLGFVGQKISEEFCELLTRNCLADTVPSTPEGLKKYNEVVVEVENLQRLLNDCQFFSRENVSILEFANNVDVLFANKTCQMYLDQAKALLKKDLHDMIEVGTDPNASTEAKKGFTFSKCYISKNVNEYLDLIRKMLDQANSSSEMCAGRLVYTAEEIVGLYYKLIPEYHKKLLETIPQQVALYHNNCMYFAHELLTLGNKISQEEKTNTAVKEENLTCHVQLLRTAGTDAFLKYMRAQVKQIENILKESELAKLGQTDKLDPACEKYVRQCLRQLELLKTVWQKVLSLEVYNKTTGELLNSFVDFLIKLVVDVEDISADNCTLLVNFYGIVKTRAPKLFTDPKEVNLYVKHWYKFSELILLLNSSLSDINDRWADGKGPLAVEFKPEEIKSLIRALFQNTDRRAAVLARIV